MPHFIRRGTANFNSRYAAELHASRTAPTAVLGLNARTLAAAEAADAEWALSRLPLATAAGYDRSAIMRVALADCRASRARGSLKPWRRLMSDALFSAWLRAKLQRSALVALWLLPPTCDRPSPPCRLPTSGRRSRRAPSPAAPNGCSSTFGPSASIAEPHSGACARSGSLPREAASMIRDAERED
jgi:hypothetical protein